jgi:hypothetical protein
MRTARPGSPDASFDHLVGAGEERERDREAECASPPGRINEWRRAFNKAGDVHEHSVVCR